MKHLQLSGWLFAALLLVSANAVAQSDVYFTKDISSESLVKIYQALGKDASGRVAVKISTGENGSNYLRPEFIKALVQSVNGTIVECNTAYGGDRSSTASHRELIKKHGYDTIAMVDIMDEEDTIHIPVTDKSHLQYNIVGSHLANYDYMINLAHFKGHQMGGFGGVLKNQSIGVASRSGKCYIHTAGVSQTNMWGSGYSQDDFLESMAVAAQSVHDYFKGNIVYINVMNNLSVDCDCNGRPEAPKMKDIGILASTDPVALDKACLDLVFNHQSTSGDNADPLITRINRQHGTHTVEYAETLGLGTQKYRLIDLDTPTDMKSVATTQLYNVYDAKGVKVLDQATSLDGLSAGVYVVNGQKYVVE